MKRVSRLRRRREQQRQLGEVLWRSFEVSESGLRQLVLKRVRGKSESEKGKFLDSEPQSKRAQSSHSLRKTV